MVGPDQHSHHRPCTGAAWSIPDHPSGLLFDEITASSLVKIDAEGNKVEPCDPQVNSAGLAMPCAVHMARPEIACVLHTHSIAGCAISMQRDGLLPLNQHALQVIGDIAYHDYEGAGRSSEERARLLADLGDRHILVLRNHGLLIVGTSVPEAFIATYRMERACAMQLAFQQSCAAFHPITDEVVSAAYNRPPAAIMNQPSWNGRPCYASSTGSTPLTSSSRG
jgi:ribulose-5-phosphate 4-epimerase/fuculose-1-phosphate aldolase